MHAFGLFSIYKDTKSTVLKSEDELNETGGEFPVWWGCYKIHKEKSFRNIIKSNTNQIVFTIFGLIGLQTDSVLLDPNQSQNAKYNLICVWFNAILKRFLSEFYDSSSIGPEGTIWADFWGRLTAILLIVREANRGKALMPCSAVV